MRKVKISELPQSSDLTGLYTIGTDANNRSVKVSMQFLKEAAEEATEKAEEAAQSAAQAKEIVDNLDASSVPYDTTNTPDLGSGDVQSAVEALDGKVEDLRDEVLGDEWVDEIHGRRFLSLGSEYGWYRNYTTLRNTNVLTGDWNANVIGFKVKAGDKFRLVGMSTNNYSYSTSSPMAAFFDVYEVPTASGSSPSNYTFPNAQFVGSYVPTPLVEIDDIVEIPQGVGMVVFRASKNGVISSGGYMWYSADDLSSCYRYLGNTLSIADKTGYKIDTWTDDEIITNTSLAVGSVVPYWSDGTRYGGRGVRLNVKEGDKVLLDTYSPALFGLIFTDENRVVKALYNDRRFDGVWTAPVNGYCYIQDVLYRENYHYASAHGHLAYMAHDARKRAAKGGDWYNELAPRVLRDVIPNVENFNAPKGTPQLFARLDGVHHSSTSSEQALATAFNAISIGKMQYKLAAFHVVVHHSSVARGAFTDIYQSGLTTTLKIATLDFNDLANEDIEGWVVSVKHCTSDKIDGGFGVYSSISTAGMLNMTFDKVFVHTSSDFGELYALAQKIINGEVEVDNFYGVREKEVDFVRNAIGLQSISDLGYNILDYGATLPIDEEGYKYAKEIYDRYKDNPPSGQNAIGLFQNDLDLVYLPTIDFSHLQEVGSDYIKNICNNCHNLVCVDNIKLPETSTGIYNNYLQKSFYNCFSLRYVGDISIPSNRVFGTSQVFENCYALEYIGRIHGEGASVLYPAGFKNCYSLKRIEEFPFLNIKNPPNNDGFLNCVNLEYLFCKDFGKSSTMTAYGTFQILGKWGINSDENPDARQSLVDSLLTYSYDRVNDPDGLGTAGTTCTITLSANSYAQLTASEIEAITAKGYTLTHP